MKIKTILVVMAAALMFPVLNAGADPGFQCPGESVMIHEPVGLGAATKVEQIVNAIEANDIVCFSYHENVTPPVELKDKAGTQIPLNITKPVTVYNLQVKGKVVVDSGAGEVKLINANIVGNNDKCLVVESGTLFMDENVEADGMQFLNECVGAAIDIKLGLNHRIQNTAIQCTSGDGINVNIPSNYILKYYTGSSKSVIVQDSDISRCDTGINLQSAKNSIVKNVIISNGDDDTTRKGTGINIFADRSGIVANSIYYCDVGINLAAKDAIIGARLATGDYFDKGRNVIAYNGKGIVVENPFTNLFAYNLMFDNGVKIEMTEGNKLVSRVKVDDEGNALECVLDEDRNIVDAFIKASSDKVAVGDIFVIYKSGEVTPGDNEADALEFFKAYTVNSEGKCNVGADNVELTEDNVCSLKNTDRDNKYVGLMFRPSVYTADFTPAFMLTKHTLLGGPGSGGTEGTSLIVGDSPAPGPGPELGPESTLLTDPSREVDSDGFFTDAMDEADTGGGGPKCSLSTNSSSSYAPFAIAWLIIMVSVVAIARRPILRRIRSRSRRYRK